MIEVLAVGGRRQSTRVESSGFDSKTIMIGARNDHSCSMKTSQNSWSSGAVFDSASSEQSSPVDLALTSSKPRETRRIETRKDKDRTVSSIPSFFGPWRKRWAQEESDGPGTTRWPVILQISSSDLNPAVCFQDRREQRDEDKSSRS